VVVRVVGEREGRGEREGMEERESGDPFQY